jgi:Flp pilus assembly protein CpaB
MAACFCAALAASLASGYGARVERQYGALRPVVVAGADLSPGKVIGPGSAGRLELHRIPARFVPPGAIGGVSEAIGRAPAAVIPRGSYVLGAQLELPKEKGKDQPGLGAGRSPVEIAVAGGEAIAAAGDPADGPLVDVIVTTEPKGSGAGRTYVAARKVQLLSLREGGEAGTDSGAPGATGTWTATLALNRAEALRLIAAENFARQVRLLPQPPVKP